jgi:phage gp16-like protein
MDIMVIRYIIVAVNCLQNFQFPAQNADGKIRSRKIIHTNIITENNWQLNSIQALILISDLIKQIKRWSEKQLSY